MWGGLGAIIARYRVYLGVRLLMRSKEGYWESFDVSPSIRASGKEGEVEDALDVEAKWLYC